MKRKDLSKKQIFQSLDMNQEPYSKQGKNIEKYFWKNSLKALIKSLDKKIENYNQFDISKYINKKAQNKDIININIVSSFKPLSDLSSLNNFHVSKLYKKKVDENYIRRMKLFKELFYIKKEKLVDPEIMKENNQQKILLIQFFYSA